MKTVQREFAARVKELRSWTDDLSASVPSVLKAGKASIEREQLSRAAITILLAGSFEHLLKQLVKRFIATVNKMKIPFDLLPDKVRHYHLVGGAEILKSRAQDEQKHSKKLQKSPPYIETHRLSEQLASVSRGVPYELIWEAFAETGSNPGPRVVGDVLRRLNTKHPWPTIAQNAPNPYQTPGTKPAAGDAIGVRVALLKNKLENLIQARNRCAHGVIEQAAPGLSTLYEYLDAVDAISEGILNTLEGELMQMQASWNPAAPPGTTPPPPASPP